MRLTYLCALIVVVRGLPDTRTHGDEAFSTSSGPSSLYRTKRQAVPAILDPFGLVQRASEVVSGGVSRFREGVARVTNSLRDAGTVVQLVGEDMAEGVSQLVDVLQSSSPAEEKNPDRVGTSEPFNAISGREGMLEGLLKLVGVNPARWGVMAINVLIYIAEMITSSLMTEGKRSDNTPTYLDLGSILKWLPFTPEQEMGQLVREAQDRSLPTHLITNLASATGNSTACIQLMVCKMAPVIWGVQKTLKVEGAWSQVLAASQYFGDVVDDGASALDTLYQQLPPKTQFVSYGDGCEHLFPACPLLRLGTRHRKHQPRS